MAEAVIVATARSPIGRAFKVSLKDLRADDLTATIIQTALAKVPELDPKDIDDLMLGCGLPGGEQGNNLGRIVAVQMGMDHLPGCTITRYCSSSLQTSRMALHAIKAGEGDVFVSAGVETVSRYGKRQVRRPAGDEEHRVRRRDGPYRLAGPLAPLDCPPRPRGHARHPYRHGRDRRERGRDPRHRAKSRTSSPRGA